MSAADASGWALARDAQDMRDPAARFDLLLGTWKPVSEAADGSVRVARGFAHQRPVIAFCTDARVQGGALGEAGCAEIELAYALARDAGCAVVGVWQSGGARLAEGVASLHAIGRIFRAMTLASGLVPQVSVVLGPAAGGAAYGPALTDVVILAPEARLFVTGPGVVESVTGEQISLEDLGGPLVHGETSGVAHIVEADAAQALARARDVVRALDPGPVTPVPVLDRDLRALLPQSARRAYDVRPVIHAVLDAGSEVELHTRWAPNLVTTLGRLGGLPVGVVANNPLRLGGCLESKSAEKAARFVRLCDSFGIPLLVLVDVPGYLPGSKQEADGVLRRGAKLLHAFSGAVVPRATLILRKAYGGAYLAMNARSLGAQTVLAWPEAEIAVMGSVAAVRVLHRRRLEAVADGEARERLELELAEQHDRLSGGLERAVDEGRVDRVVSPAQTRSTLLEWLADAYAAGVPRGHMRNIPL